MPKSPHGGRSKGGLTTKIHALVDANGLPILLKITPGQAHDGRSAADMFDSLGAGDVLLADRAYDSDALRAEMEERGVFANIRLMPQRVRKPPFSANLYKLRNAVERLLPPFGRCLRPSKIKHYRAIATRYEKHPENYLALIKLAAARIWIRFMSR
jgi:transposase